MSTSNDGFARSGKLDVIYRLDRAARLSKTCGLGRPVDWQPLPAPGSSRFDLRQRRYFEVPDAIFAPVLTASDLQMDFIVVVLPLESDESPLFIELMLFTELAVLAFIAALLAAASIVYVFVFVLSMTFGSPGEHTAFVVPAFADPFFIPVD